MGIKDEIRMFVMSRAFDGISISRGDLISMGYAASDVIDAIPSGTLSTDPESK